MKIAWHVSLRRTYDGRRSLATYSWVYRHHDVANPFLVDRLGTFVLFPWAKERGEGEGEGDVEVLLRTDEKVELIELRKKITSNLWPYGVRYNFVMTEMGTEMMNGINPWHN